MEISWEQYHKDVNDLALKINGNPCDRWPILAIGRGGLVPATMLSHMLGNNQRVYSFDCQTREIAMSSLLPTRILMHKWPPFEKGAFEEILVVDDMIDSGMTLYNISKVLPSLGVARIETAIVYLKNWDVAAAADGKCFFGRVLETTEWIDFPYEKAMI